MIRLYVIVAAGLVLANCEPVPPDYDLLITGGTVYDGSLRPGRIAAIGIADDRILTLDAVPRATAVRVIDATGMLVVPGFIDPHTHAQGNLPESQRVAKLNYLTQGVTTVFIGNDGRGLVDRTAAFEFIETQGSGTNVAFLAGHGQIRKTVMNLENRTPTGQELTTMKTLLAHEMQAGAFGLSTGLFYAPGSFANTDEVIELARVAADYGGIYDTHMRSEGAYGDGLLAAVEETLRIGREAGIAVHISHIKALGKPVWGQSREIIRMIESARQGGASVTANQYPWRASGTRFGNALIPRWAAAESKERMVERLDDQVLGPKIRDEMRANLGFRGGPDAMLVTAAVSRWRGRTLTEIATVLEVEPIEAALRLIIADDPSIASFVMDPGDIEALSIQPWVMTGSDGSSGHPRLFATYPKAWDDLVRRGSMDIANFVRRSSGLVADTFNICERGYVREGYVADLMIIDPEQYLPRASYESPTKLSEGVAYALVNGVIVIDHYDYSGDLPGQVLRRTDCND